MPKYYDCTKLLSLKDINGKDPEIYIAMSNRNAGKTTNFGRLLVNRFLKKGQKFALLYRFNYELDDVNEKFFKDIKSLFFHGYDMTSEKRSKGIYHELYIGLETENGKPDPNRKSCGYALSINSADQIKKMSHKFSDVSAILFDEFQSETGHYCQNELKKFQSIHGSIARGQGSQSRRVPVYMLSNTVSTINPYFVALGVSSTIKPETKFLRGDGFVIEQGYNESAGKAVKESAFSRAFSRDSYVDYASGQAYLNDSNTFIENVSGRGRYAFTIKTQGHSFGVYEYIELGIMYVSDKADETNPNKIAVDVNDHDINYVLLNRYDGQIAYLRALFERGCFRFKNQLCKSALLRLINYDIL